MADLIGANRVSRKHLRRYIEKKSAEHKDDVAREVRRYGQVRPAAYQGSSKGYKSYSKQRFPSVEFRNGYVKIQWDDGVNE